jgi:uncharacterized protein YodC (DUF2158 family)
VAQFKIGDTVRLKSGGPVMVVSQVEEYSGFDGLQALCKWFAGTKAEESLFPLETLEAAEK